MNAHTLMPITVLNEFHCKLCQLPVPRKTVRKLTDCCYAKMVHPYLNKITQNERKNKGIKREQTETNQQKLYIYNSVLNDRC